MSTVQQGLRSFILSLLFYTSEVLRTSIVGICETFIAGIHHTLNLRAIIVGGATFHIHPKIVITTLLLRAYCLSILFIKRKEKIAVSFEKLLKLQNYPR